MTKERLLVWGLFFLVLQLSFVSNTSANANTNTNAVENRCFDTRSTYSDAASVSAVVSNSGSNGRGFAKEYDVYIILTPFENSIGRAVAEELSRHLSGSASPPNNSEAERSKPTKVICMVRYPSLVSSTFHTSHNVTETNTENDGCKEGILNKFYLQLLQRIKSVSSAYFRDIAKKFRKDLESEHSRWLDAYSKNSPILVLPQTGTNNDFSFDPFGEMSGVQHSCKSCLATIQRELLQCVTTAALTSQNSSTTTMSDGNANDLLSATIRIRGILFNPYGCPPPFASKPLRSRIGSGESLLASRSSFLSPLSAYKLLSVAIFMDEAFKARTTILQLPTNDTEHQHRRLLNNERATEKSIANVECEEASKPLRIIIVGTEAARGLPKMGIPVPNLKGATESCIRKKMLLSTNNDESSGSEGSDWEEKYAEMNAMMVLYLKALQSQLSTKAKSTIYLGVVSPGMTPESFNIAHVPERARTLAFRWKLWLCQRRWVLDWLKKAEIAKSTQHAGSLLVTALLNAPIQMKRNDKVKKSTRTGCLRWDDVYASGSFVGAKSGTGGPLCEQSLLLYNATSNSVSLAANDTSGDTSGFNFLASRRLQGVVHRVVREMIANEFSDSTGARFPK